MSGLSSTSQRPEPLPKLVRAILSSLLAAFKGFALYAEDHAFNQKAVARLQEDLTKFLEKHGTLVLDVEKNQLLFQGDLVHHGAAKDGELAFALFRDGITKLLFQPGVDLQETSTLIGILDKYKMLPLEPEGDIVTALWEAALPHIQYEAASNALEVDGPPESSPPKKGQDWLQSMSPGGNASLESSNVHTGVVASVLAAHGIKESPPINLASVQLTAEEAERLEEMVKEEEERDATQETLNMLSDILKEHQDEVLFSHVLEYVTEELRSAFACKDFDIALRILTGMNQIRILCREAGPWANSRIRDFLVRVSQPDFLEGLRSGWATVTARDIARAKEVLVFFPPAAIPQFGSILREAPAQVQDMLAEVILILAGRDIRPLCQLLAAADENLAIHLVPLLVKMKSDDSAQLLFKTVRHQSEKVRWRALRAIIIRRLWFPEMLLPLLDDESAAVRHLVLKYLSSQRSGVTELLLIEYIKGINPQQNGADWLIACFKALGKCGTDQSFPFLEDTLLKGSWLSRLRDSPRRRGAAIALRYMDTRSSNEVLEKACQSHFPAIRNAAQTAYSAQVH
jgi:hypothetical protein